VKLNIIDFDNNSVGEVSISKDIFGCEIRSDVMYRVVQWQLDKRRSGNHKTKAISEISGTTKKPYKQKGTGRARHGSLRSNIHRGGAIIFGPLVRDHGYSIQKKVRKAALKMALSQKVKDKKLIVIKDYKIKSHKTKELSSKLSKLGYNDALFLGVEPNENNKNFLMAYRNIKNLSALSVEGANVYDILKYDHLIIDQDSLKKIEERLQK
jgi:large subunit ribosomal protein L4